ncbi:phage tail tape measure protein [Streptomyces sp. NPDC057651]|uniref:phage tail tape measure protein n=1 Tax=Streptomyces sp. NPDC057651 TaxID=3346194 RepID=UPI0036C9DE88
MALTVGELAATITVDDSEGASGLRRFQGRMRDALDRITSSARSSGEDAGQGLGDGLADGAADGADRAADGIGGKLQDFAAGAIGAGLGAALMGGFASALEQGQITSKLGAQLGATTGEAQRYGDIAGNLYAGAITEDFQGAADAIRVTMSAGLAPPAATNAQIESIATKVSDLAGTFELDLGQAANAVGQIMKTGLAPNAEAALDTITRGLQVMGPRADDIVDTFNEYSTAFRNLGLDATTATGLMSQGLKAGARDTDIVADALKEFLLIVQGGGAKVDEAFASIGLNGKEMQAAFTQGGPKASAALDKVFDALRGVGDQSKRQALAVTLFGTKSEDMQKALFSLDPSKATDALGKVGGAAGKLGDTLRDNASTKLKQFQRGATQAFVEVLGRDVVPILEKFGGFVQQNISWLGPLAGIIFGVAVAMGAWTAAQALFNAVMAMNPIVMVVGAIIGLIAVIVLAYQHSERMRAIVGAAWEYIKIGITVAVAYIKGAILWFAGLPGMLAGWFGAARDYAVQKFTDLQTWLSGLPGRAGAALSGLVGSLRTAAVNGFNSFRTAAVSKAQSFIAWVRGIPGMISRALSSLGTLLVSKGKDVVRGLWNGIKSMGAWLKSTLIGWAKDLIPGPIAKALGIHSPSRVMADQVGRWIPAGVVEGIKSGQGAVDKTMSNLVSTPTVGASGAVAGGAGSGSGSVTTIRIELSGPEAVKSLIRKIVQVDGGGNVQTAFGR